MLQFNASTQENGTASVTVFVNGRLMPPIDESHPNFKAIVAACQASILGEEDIDELEVVDLFDIPATIERKFQRLSARVTVQNGEVLFDGDPVQPGLSSQILRFMDEGEDFEPLVNFMEKVMLNPQEHSREQAWTWFNNHNFTITEDGDVVIYKGVNHDLDGGYCSGFRGTAMVNDTLYENQRIPYAVGNVVTMPRSEVAHDPGKACSTGLHVGTYSYAQNYGRTGALLRVLVNPRDVVSVPDDAHGEKIRVCRFVIDAIIDGEDTMALYKPDDADTDLSFGEGDFIVGTRVRDEDGDEATIIAVDDDDDERVQVQYDNDQFGTFWTYTESLSQV